MGPETNRLSGAVATSLMVIAVGVLLLLNQIGAFPARYELSFWSIILVAFGAAKLLSSHSHDRHWGALTIVLGILLQLNYWGFVHFRFWDLWPALIIAVGAMLLWNALQGKNPLAFKSATGPNFEGEFDLNYIFGGGEPRLQTKEFRGGRLTAIFGGFKLDLSRAEIQGNEATIEANAVFGGGEILVPETWHVILHGSGIFGGYDNKTRYFQPDASQPSKTLTVKGSAVFGGIVIKNY
jgi:predicted membrane protein